MSLSTLVRAALAIGFLLAGVARAAGPQTVYFPSADGKTELVGYLYSPGSGTHPAVVLLHGRAGPYSSHVNAECTTVARGVSSPCSAATLSKRHQMWAEYWVGHGYAALLVDSFGPRGRAHGFGRGTHDDPAREAVNERSVRPLDAEGALAWLVVQPGVNPSRVMLQGWSNGGSTVLNTVHRQAEAGRKSPRFRAALAFYPGCGPKALLARKLRSDLPLLMLLGSNDEEVNPSTCREVAERSTPAVPVQWYDGATHDFDDPGKTRQGVPANRSAQADALRRASAFFDAAP
ncbi:dienelactone hydrolase family protein [Ideonella sp. B508-1]|uniref:dienelactone hydrolase family protein n=1 Tax=Ideonella sp. B508-1 TaxID=137716 RepID=UPI000476F2B2|nr:dienelactone hydrolase family protein [Ideonella sp. B508-1]